MEPSEKDMWEININNAAAEAAAEYGEEVVASVFARYGSRDFEDLSPMYYSEVFADLQMIAEDK